MALLIPEGFAHCAIPLKHSSLAREAIVTFGVGETSGLFPVAQADAIFGAWAETLGVEIDGAVTQGPIQVTYGTATGEGLAVVGTDTFISTSDISSEPPNVAVLFKKGTARGGRRGRGRMFVPWLGGETVVDELGNISPVFVEGLNTVAQNFLDELADETDADSPMYLLHSTDPDQSTAPGSPNLVTSLICDPLVATQRRRLGR